MTKSSDGRYVTSVRGQGICAEVNMKNPTATGTLLSKFQFQAAIHYTLKYPSLLHLVFPSSGECIYRPVSTLLNFDDFERTGVRNLVCHNKSLPGRASFIRSNPVLIIDLKKSLYTADTLGIFERIWR